MKPRHTPPHQFPRENASLRARLEAAEAILRVIREGEIDAVIASGSRGHRLLAPAGSQSLSRLMRERNDEAAFATTPDGRLLLCNDRAVALLQRTRDDLVGHLLEEFMTPAEAPRLHRLLQDAVTQITDGCVAFQAPGGDRVPVHLWVGCLSSRDDLVLCLIGTDLSPLGVDLQGTALAEEDGWERVEIVVGPSPERGEGVRLEGEAGPPAGGDGRRPVNPDRGG